MTITNYTYMAKVELPYLMTGVLGFDCVPCEGDAKVNFGCNTLFSFWCTQKCRYAYSTDSTIDNTSIYPASITQYIYEYELIKTHHYFIHINCISRFYRLHADMGRSNCWGLSFFSHIKCFAGGVWLPLPKFMPVPHFLLVTHFLKRRYVPLSLAEY